MRVLMISPGFPTEMPLFTRGLARVGAEVYGLGDQPRSALAPDVAASLHDYLQVRDLWDEARVVGEVRHWLGNRRIDRVEVLWEPGMMLAAKLREALGAPGLRAEQTVPFRDKERMKRVLDAAGIRTPHHYDARTREEVRQAADRIGYPIIVKPLDGAGSADTWPIRSNDELEHALRAIQHVPVVSVEEFIEGEEYTYDTVCAHGTPLFENVGWYRPGPLIARLNPWISAVNVCYHDLDQEIPAQGREMGRRVLDALGFESGFTHMEWFRTKDGEAVFGEIGGRSPGGRLVHVMNYSTDADLFTGWAEAVCHGRISQDVSKKFAAAVIFKKAQGAGPRITAIEGLESVFARFGEHIAAIDLNRVGAPKRDWRKIVHGDGWIVVRHPDFETTCRMADSIATDLILRAG
ncbi:MAG: ATP-grasp domain-containing protein [Planctomycetes bacterium]|nr:ATP-grasp domain-containing protein [Planctomycetota bacterium]